MIKSVLISFIVLLTNICSAQQNTFNKDAELQRFMERGGKVTETAPNIYELQHLDGTKRVFNFNHYDKVNIEAGTVDTTIINIWEIDTTKYADKFSFWQKVDIVNNFENIVFVDDLNKNGLLELYGFSEGHSVFVGPVKIFEQNKQGIFQNVYSYDSNSVYVHGIGDINSDGNKEIFLRTNDTINGKFYKSDSLSQLPTNFDFVFYYIPNQVNDMTFGDFDKNGITDCAFIDGAGTQKVIIGEYKKNINNFITVFADSTTNLTDYSGFAIDDFDKDSKTDLAFGTGQGTIKVIENIDTNQYNIVWQDMFPTYNAYMHAATNDIDGNGKPEFWIGGQDFEQGISLFIAYEADGDNSYHPVAMIELRYLVSLDANYLQAADVDGDGKEDLVISLGEYILILKFTGRPNYHSYEIFYVKNNEQTQPGNTFRPVTIYDLNGDGKKDILLPMDKYVAPNLIFFSYLLKQNIINSVSEGVKNQLTEFNIYQNYPNPFNPSTQIKYTLAKDADVTVKVYDMLGTEVAKLINETQAVGNHTINFNAKNLSSGVYIYRITAINNGRILFTDSKQMILLR